MSVKNIVTILTLFVLFLVGVIFIPSLFTKKSADSVTLFWKEKKDKDYIIYKNFITAWDEFIKTGSQYYNSKPSMFFWYNNKMLELAMFYLNVGEIYDRFLYNIAGKYPEEFGIFRKVDFSSFQIPPIKDLNMVPFKELNGVINYYYYRSYEEIGKQYLKSVYTLTRAQLLDIPQFDLTDIDLLLINIEVASALEDTEFVKHCISLLDSSYKSSNPGEKEEFWTNLYNDKSYKFYQLYKSFTYFDLNKTEFYKEWINEYDDIAGKIYSFVNHPGSGLAGLFSYIDDDPFTMEHYTYIIPDICLSHIDNETVNELSVQEKDLIFSYISHCITKSGTDHLRLDFILLPIIYNSDKLDYLGVVLGELNKIKQYSQMQMLSPLIEIISRVMIKMTGKMAIEKK